MTSPTQKQLDFDMATLNSCIAALKDKRMRTLFRGLLLTAAMEPHRVSDIDDAGYILMTAPVETVANWSGVHVRTIHRCRSILAHLVEQDGGTNTPSEWWFTLRHIMPPEAISWFRELWESTKTPPRHFENATPAFCTARPGILRAEVPNATPAFSNLTSICFQLSTAKLASLLEVLKSLGIEASGTTWENSRIDENALTHPAALTAIADVVATTPAERRRVFVAAVVSQSKDSPWNYFRNLVSTGNYLTTHAPKQHIRQAETLQRLAIGADAIEILPKMDAAQAFAQLRTGLKKYSLRHESAALAEYIGPEIRAAAIAAGGMNAFNDISEYTQRNLQQAFTAAWNDLQTVTAAQR